MRGRHVKRMEVICSFEKTKLLKGAKLVVPKAANPVRGQGESY
jgi:hypothetical protein